MDRTPARGPSTLLATWFGVGLVPIAPGTFGSLAALPLGLVIVGLFGWVGLAVASVVLYLIGILVVGRYMARTGRSDPKEVVIDEVAGQLLPLLAAPVEFLPWLTAFVLFRIFDILKPWPCSYFDRKHHGGFGVMTDDIAAGAYALFFMLALNALGVWQ